MKNQKKGFTLIELLVVMAIIAVLTTLMIYAINAARTQSRNTQRRNTVNTTKAALEAYFASQKCYPKLATGTCTAGAGAAIPLETLLAGTALQPYIPGTGNQTFTDPNNEAGRQCYLYKAPGKYDMWLITEPAGTGSATCAAAKPASTTAGFEDFSVQ